jgi:uncharacterized damage-inducible protein DinB
MSRVLKELLRGKHAHADSLACVDVTAGVAGRRPEPLPFSIWQLVWHVNYWMEYELGRIAGSRMPYPEHAALSWPAPAPPDAEAWRREVARFGELLGRLESHADASAEDLARPIVPSADPRGGREIDSLEDVLWQTVVHNSYHLGQVVVIRKALGVWPPSSGADTW